MFFMAKLFEAGLKNTEQKKAFPQELKSEFMLISPKKSDLMNVVGTNDLKEGYKALRSSKMNAIHSFVELYQVRNPRNLSEINIDVGVKEFLTGFTARFHWFCLLPRPKSWTKKF